jgi:CRP/FNR family cyclic AMP-dependent transcriptional regulator
VNYPGREIGLPEASMMNRRTLTFNSRQFLKKVGTQKTTRRYQEQQAIYSQGDAADAMFYIQNGTVKLTVVSQSGKKAVIGILGRGDLFGTACLAKQSLRTSGATAIHQSTIACVKRGILVRMIHQDPIFAKLFISYLLSRIVRIREDLVDQLFNLSEKRLARILLSLAHFGKEGSDPVIPNINQGTFAEMVGTTRSRVSHFMNKFRKLGLIDYNRDGLTVHVALLRGALRD